MMKFLDAAKLAVRIQQLLQPHAAVVDIAGSIRRLKPEVKDIEIVCVPRYVLVETDLFNKTRMVSKDFTRSVHALANKINKGNTEGKYMQIELKGGAVLDLFMPAPADYYRQLALRTGSAEYSSFVIAKGWRMQGWCGSDKGLRRISDCVQVHGDSWKCTKLNGEIPPAWQSEEEFFDWIKVKWIDPKFREVKSSINIVK